MSEKVYALLLRLYPAHFREAYGAAALDLFRNRLRDERGFIAGLRLWLDLLADLAITLPREHRRAHTAFAHAPARRSPYGVPSFYILEGESIPPGALFGGAILSLALAAASFAVGHFAKFRSFAADGGFAGLMAAQTATTSAGGSAGSAARISRDARERRRVIDAVISSLKAFYVDPSLARTMADALEAHKKAGDYDGITDGAAFAALITRQLREVSHDMHVEVVYNRTRLPDGPPAPILMQPANCGLEPVRILNHKIGYLKLASFPNPSVCRSAVTAAMNSLNSADAVIFDLRDNRGGYPGAVMLIAAWLFDHPEYMYNPRENTTERLWTRSPVAGSRLADKPVYILTSAKTLSGAEHFSYDLKMLKRATLVC